MAKVRRIIRKSRPAAPHFDDQLWPVNVALFVLGGFAIGTAAAYQQFDDPRWWANAWTPIIAVPLVIAGAMFGMRYVGNRLVRRGMQLSLVLSLLAHLLFVVATLELTIFSRTISEVAVVREPSRRVVPDISPFRPRVQDHERPIETETPEPETEPVEREQVEQTQAPPQPTPVPEVQPTPEPTISQRQEQQMPTPRSSERPAQVARSQRTVTPEISQAAPSPQSTTSRSPRSAMQAAASAVQRRPAASRPAPRMAQVDPAEATPSRSQPTRRASAAATPQDTRAATLPRALAAPSRTPAANAVAQRPAPAQQNTPQPLRAAPTQTQRQATTSPRVARATVEPTPVTPDRAASAVQRRQQPTPERPTVAATPAPTPSRSTRVTARPQPQTVASTQSPTPSPNSASQRPSQAAATAVSRANTQVDAQRAASSAPTSPAPARTNATIARRQSDATTPSSNPAPSQLTRRRTPQPRNAPAVAQATAPSAATQTASSDAPLAPASTAVNRQASAEPNTAPAAGAPTTPGARQAATRPSPSRSTRQQSQDAPVLAQNPGGVSRRRPTPNSRPEIATAASDAAVSSSPSPTAQSALRPAMASMSRQSQSSPGAADRNRPSRDTPTASSQTQLAQASQRRSSPSDMPSVQPAIAASTPRRAAASGDLASPTPIDNPALARSTQSDGQQPSMQPAPTALSKGTKGAAGIGRSPNLDRNDPAADNPAMVASASATRRESTRAEEAGQALNNSDAALIARNRAGAPRPTSVLQAELVETATEAGASTPSQISASSAAAMTRSVSNSQAGAVTATKGESEVDIGPTRLVANSASDRAAGGGQPELNFETQTQQVARNSRGGEASMSLAAEAVADMPTAPAAEGGGEPQVEAPANSMVAQRMEAGGNAPASGGPSQAAMAGPVAEPNAAELLAELQTARAAGDDAATPGGATGGSEGDPDEDEEERARRVARSRRGGPAADLAGATVSDVPQAPAAEAAAEEPGGLAGAPAAAADVARQSLAAGGMQRAPSARTAAGAAATAEGGAELAGVVEIQRAEAVEAVAAMAAPGGGSNSPQRASVGPQFVADTRAEEIAAAGQLLSGGLPDASPAAAEGLEVGRTASGTPSPAEGPLGARAAEAPAAGPGPAPGAALAQRSEASGDDPGPVADSGPLAGGPRRRAAQLGAPDVVQADSPGDMNLSQPSAPDSGNIADLAAAANIGPLSRAANNSSLDTPVDMVEGPSGLVGADWGAPGVSSRRALADSTELASRTPRYPRRASGGLPDFNTAAIAASDAFRSRNTRQGAGESGARGRPGPQTERAIESGLVFLSKHQLSDGSWSLKGINNEDVTFSSDAAATGLCLLAFQGAGYNHLEHKYAAVVRSGLDFLLKNQQEDGSLFVPADARSNEFVKLYTHGIAAIALCEAYGMTQDPALKEPAQKALDYIVSTQDPSFGGWRYTPGRFSDTSVSGWMMMALKSGDLAGLEVPRDAYDRLSSWFDRAQASDSERHLYCYNPLAPDTAARRLGRVPSKSMTSVGLLARLYTGWQRDNPDMVRGAKYLSLPENLPAMGFSDEANPLEKKRDTYYWYYGTQVMFHMGGEYWEAWNGALHPLLVETQEKTGAMAGSWDPYKPVHDRWGIAVGRVYVTTMNLLSLEVYYRHLPLYEDTAG